MPDLTPDLTIPTLPVICEKCRATGMAGDLAFAAIPDILNFTPVERRAHVNGWRPEHQRAFIAALAITGSPRQAARAIGRHAFGAEQLRNHRGGKSFAAAWDAALELARERETHRIHENLAELAAQRDEQIDQLAVRPERVDGRSPNPAPESFPPCYDPELDDEERLEHLRAKENIRHRLLRARRLLLYAYAADEDPAKRAAWEVLVGPCDWGKAERMEPQDDEPCPDPGGMRNPEGMPSLRKADMVLTIESGLLPELTGNYEVADMIRESTERSDAGA